MLRIADLSKKELNLLYKQTADLLELVEQLVPTTSTTGLTHHGIKLMAVIEERLAAIDPLPRPASRRSRRAAAPSEVQ
jgi:hypothetical protein